VPRLFDQSNGLLRRLWIQLLMEGQRMIKRQTLGHMELHCGKCTRWVRIERSTKLLQINFVNNCMCCSFDNGFHMIRSGECKVYLEKQSRKILSTSELYRRFRDLIVS